ncbi:C40 family peptidase [Paenibacillus sp. N1-5-1-14]|uniref:C40 family peptidase n=1 Tax=Paenibacillus radicibacter TaxID=2972488 RepID=UPI0021599C10|nr:C40 family peptidase [Paenibacillus radicibacter]MCR8643143.1 C40 family peptidase [Paenibacillus radicibacter]
MNTTTKTTMMNRWAKRITVLTISFTIAFSGMFVALPGSANAKAAEKNQTESKAKAKNDTTNKTSSADKTAAKQDTVADVAYSSNTSQVDQLLKHAAKYLGTPYKFGASANQTKTFDCSSFTLQMFKKFGVKLERTARAQAKQGKYVARKNLQKGDLVFFKIPSRPYDVGHVGIYVGNNTMIHASGSKGVTYSKITGYWDKNYQTARRVAL